MFGNNQQGRHQQNRFHSRFLFGIAICGMVAVSASITNAQVIVDSAGFEPPVYDTAFLGSGQLEGQGPSFSQTWQRTTGNASEAFIESSVIHSGTQALQVNRAANADERWSDPEAGWPSPPRTIIQIEWDMRVDDPMGSQPFGPFFGIDSYDHSGPAFPRLGMFGVDATTRELLYVDNSDQLVVVDSSPLITYGDWNHFLVVLDYGSDKYRMYYNDSLVQTSDFVDSGLDQFTDADISALAASGDALSLAATGTAYFDNFIVRQVPEPSSLILLLGSTICLGFLSRRRTKKS